MVQELQTAAEDMQKLGEAMAELFERTAQAIRTGSLLFEQADNGAAKDWKGCQHLWPGERREVY